MDFSEKTSAVEIATGNLERFYIIIDDSIKLKVVGRPTEHRCIINNVPKGRHTFVVVKYLGWSNRESYKHEFTVLSTGNREQIELKLPVPRYDSNYNTLQIVVASIGVLTYLIRLGF